MNSLLPIIMHMIIFHCILMVISLAPRTTFAFEPPCRTRCGSLEVKFPLGTGHGCGSPRFHPYVACSPDGSQLRLTTHTGTYPITSISYADSLITIAPPCIPFQLGPSTFILLACSSSTYSITINGNPICDPSSIYLCASIYTCPGVVSLGLPLFPPTNSCCVYSPANLDPKDELDLEELKCAGYSSVVALGDVPADPAQWQYGVALKYTLGGLDSYNIAPSCHGCELSGGACGYAPPRNSFVCVCDNGNTTTDCYSYNWIFTSSSLQSSGSWLGILAVSVFLVVI
ncbi:hypothetical protein Pfo_018743 [Paulownia fortunei]|nr:hypothetical protein Pfo_018743 [Paulownia fortunei]